MVIVEIYSTKLSIAFYDSFTMYYSGTEFKLNGNFPLKFPLSPLPS